MLVVRRQTTAFRGADGEAKLAMEISDFADLEQDTRRALNRRLPTSAVALVAFSTLGLGQPRKSSREEFTRVDFGYNIAFARACNAAGARHFSLLSSVEADPNARTHYLRLKGEIEAAIAALGFQRVSFFRPSLLFTKDIRYGLQDRLTRWVFPMVSRFLPSRFHEITVEDLGRAMRLNAERSDGTPVEYLHYGDFRKLLVSAAG